MRWPMCTARSAANKALLPTFNLLTIRGAEMNELLSRMRINSFRTILSAYQKAGIELHSAIDGGAGSGATATEMLPYLSRDCVVHAFEPFVGNHRFFEGRDAKIRLIKKALSDRNTTMTLSVPHVVPADSTWGRGRMEGYSSAGRLVGASTSAQAGPGNSRDLAVECVRADDELQRESRIGFVKLDLQGGELHALQGMRGLLKDVYFMWVEYMGASDLHDYLVEEDFIVFDTEYLFRGKPSEHALNSFVVSRERGQLSSGSTIWCGYKKRPWGDFPQEFLGFRKSIKLIQTDLVCVNSRYLSEFIAAARFLAQDVANPT